jgi:predicted metal-binding protein
MGKIARIAKARTQWEDILLVCSKCSRKARGGFGPKGRKRLDKVLRDELDLGKGRKARIRIVMTPCFKLCPRKGVTVAKGSKPDTLYIVPHGMAVEEIAETLEIAPAKAETFIDWPFTMRSAAE